MLSRSMLFVLVFLITVLRSTPSIATPFHIYIDDVSETPSVFVTNNPNPSNISVDLRYAVGAPLENFYLRVMYADSSAPALVSVDPPISYLTEPPNEPSLTAISDMLILDNASSSKIQFRFISGDDPQDYNGYVPGCYPSLGNPIPSVCGTNRGQETPNYILMYTAYYNNGGVNTPFFDVQVKSIPEPSALVLLGIGFVALSLARFSRNGAIKRGPKERGQPQWHYLVPFSS